VTSAPSAVVPPQDVPEENEFTTEHHVYEPHRVGLPALRPYMRELWRRRHFATELGKTTMRADETQTFFGQLWLVLNPMLLASVYFLLVDVVSGGHKTGAYFVHLVGGLFAYYLVSNCLIQGSNSVVKGGRLILNTAFPRLLLPLSSVYMAVRRFLPTMIVYFAMHLIAGLPVSINWLWAFVIFFELVTFGAGLAFFTSTLQVYFRDTSSFLPYFTRIWLYLSPVLYYVENMKHALKHFIYVNPLVSILGNWGRVLTEDRRPSFHFLLAGMLWGVGTFVVGALFFMSRERDFAVRL
jgi:teichoic acid transport system permease protein